MADHICRTLRDGTHEGELAVALSIKDCLSCPFGFHAFNYFFADLCTNVSVGKSHARGIILIALDRSPLSYIKFLEGRGLDISSSCKWLHILDCFSDPLGWKMKIQNAHTTTEDNSSTTKFSICTDVRDLDNLISMVLKIGRGVIGEEKGHFAVAVDSVSTFLRHASLSSITKFLSNLRTSDKVSSIIWLSHSDLHEPFFSAALDYISTVVASLIPEIDHLNGEASSKNLSLLEHNLVGGRFHVRMKRRNGRVKILSEKFQLDQGCIRFVSSVMDNATAFQNIVPKVQFNLQLSEKERADRAKVVLPFEHQGDGDNIKIYDGRQSRSEHNAEFQNPHGKGEIHYIRDSDDELPDSDEDPDDDLDI